MGKTSRYLLPKSFSNVIDSVINDAIIQQYNDCLREISSKSCKETINDVTDVDNDRNVQRPDNESNLSEIKEAIKYHRDVYQIEDDSIKNSKFAAVYSQLIYRALKLTEKL
jgi:hypothetical protein